MKLIRVECEQCRGNGEVILDGGFINAPCAFCKGDGSYIKAVNDDWEPDDENEEYYLEGWVDD